MFFEKCKSLMASRKVWVALAALIAASSEVLTGIPLSPAVQDGIIKIAMVLIGAISVSEAGNAVSTSVTRALEYQKELRK